jgi:hypothetical protein
MIGFRLLRRRRNDKPVNPKILIWLAIAVAASFLFLQFWNWIEDQERTLLPAAASLIESVDNLVPLPTETFGASIYATGLYTSSSGEIPQGTVAVVYVRDDWRFVEIDYLPNLVAQTYLNTHFYPTQEVKLDQETSVWIQTIDDRPRCIDYEDDVPNRCEISRQLIAQLDDRLLLIAADGDHPTDGEMIELARSIITKTSE